MSDEVSNEDGTNEGAGHEGAGPDDEHGASTRSTSPRRRLTRSRRDRMIAGVSGGLGDYFDVDPIVFRIGFVVLTFLGGSGVLLYVLGWLLLPAEGERESCGQRVVRRGVAPSTLGVVLLLIAAGLLAHDAFHFGAGGVTSAALLIGAGALLLGWRPSDETPAGPPPRPEPPGVAPDDEPPAPPTPPPTPRAEAPPPPPPPPPRRPRSMLGRAVLGAVLILAGLAALADTTEAFDVSVEGVVAAALIVVGLGLIVGGWWGRARWLIVVAALLTVALGFMNTVDVPLEGGFGERDFRPQSIADVRDEYRLFAGEMRLDFSRVAFPPGTTDVAVSTVFGEVVVVVPADVTVVVDAEVDAGQIELFGSDEDRGLGSDARTTSAGSPGSGTLRLDIEVGAGQIEVRRGAS